MTYMRVAYAWRVHESASAQVLRFCHPGQCSTITIIMGKRRSSHLATPVSPSVSLSSPFPKRHSVRGATRALLWPISTLLHYAHSLLSWLLVAVLALGPMPHHVGFVMDGNRRYARSHGQRIARGHQQGSESLQRVGMKVV